MTLILQSTCGLYYTYELVQGFRNSILASPLKSEDAICINKKTNPYRSYVGQMAEKMIGMDQKFIVAKKAQLKEVQAVGNLLSKKAGILIPKKIDNSSENAYKFFIAVKVAQFKANDNLILDFVPTITAIAVTILLNSFSPVGACLAGLVVDQLSHILLSRWRIKKAYMAAGNHCSLEIQTAALKFIQQYQKEAREQIKVIVKSSLKEGFSLFHSLLVEPSSKDKIKILEESIQQLSGKPKEPSPSTEKIASSPANETESKETKEPKQTLTDKMKKKAAGFKTAASGALSNITKKDKEAKTKDT